MLSTSFLRTLNLKKYQDFTEENRNRLRVYYIRTINKLNRQAKLNKNLRLPQNSSSNHNAENSKENLDCSGQKGSDMRRTDGGLVRKDRENTEEKAWNNNRELLRKYNQDHFEAKNIVLNFEATRLQCEKRMQNIEKENNYLYNCKIACSNRGRKTVGRKQKGMINFKKPTTPRYS